MLLLLAALIEHLLEELKLGLCACDQKEGGREDVEENSGHAGVGCKRGRMLDPETKYWMSQVCWRFAFNGLKDYSSVPRNEFCRMMLVLICLIIDESKANFQIALSLHKRMNSGASSYPYGFHQHHPATPSLNNIQAK